ncbi:hypothetical protein HYH03_011134 [Edaphochlamys debaryana]|uniref:Uncharacterized protein n=1 Tax=Edaphochlamys debaryana TaxID=47281 RepID=A0A836BVZ4_9CHLO|nr:hypothetical protein HYH03_011134 [Edaphochlamys debaryana]|eukprot:KAG2490512.1 hypothetical protein HYH03_011134 [Edaphochlamys debaryana]
MSLAQHARRVLAHRPSALLAALSPACSIARFATKPSDASDDDAPSTSGSEASLPGWLKGPALNKPNKSLEDEWEEVKDGDGGVRWRSVLTGETTVPGAPKPDTWIEVVDKKTGLIYYWCKRTGVTTTLGEPKPGPYGRKVQLDAEDLEDGAAEGGGRAGGGPSLMRLVTNPLVVGVSLMAAAGIAYELLLK